MSVTPFFFSCLKQVIHYLSVDKYAQYFFVTFSASFFSTIKLKLVFRRTSLHMQFFLCYSALCCKAVRWSFFSVIYLQIPSIDTKRKARVIIFHCQITSFWWVRCRYVLISFSNSRQYLELSAIYFSSQRNPNSSGERLVCVEMSLPKLIFSRKDYKFWMGFQL